MSHNSTVARHLPGDTEGKVAGVAKKDKIVHDISNPGLQIVNWNSLCRFHSTEEDKCPPEHSS
jgi:hypothetical protein